MPLNSRRRDGFTLIELLVVITIIAILAALLFPVLVKARGKAKQAMCVAHLKQVGYALLMYVDDYDGYWPNCGGEWGSDAYYHTLGTHYFPEFMEPYVKSNKIWECPADYGGGDPWPQAGYERTDDSFYHQCGASFQFIPQKWVWNDGIHNYVRRWTGPVWPSGYERQTGMPYPNSTWYGRKAWSARRPAEFPLIADILQWHHEQPPPGTDAMDQAFSWARRNVWFADGHAQSLIETEFRRVRDEVVQYPGAR